MGFYAVISIDEIKIESKSEM